MHLQSSIFDPDRHWIQYPRIGSNTGLDRRSKIEDAPETFPCIFNLRSSIQAGIGSNTRLLDPIPAGARGPTCIASVALLKAEAEQFDDESQMTIASHREASHEWYEPVRGPMPVDSIDMFAFDL
ncbi:hypothetical protein AK812_SmicGene23294 [Symbiodinium microadriaticum]|uniref:Uncharacterized protein n=1 Tax=Symbiodinium microadriaticum TaxID=2951 RepID=A0A1Q9DHS1_SYMMI|nr:hypothetical protein AK812_SmicGene23294 [Symbiodinium microadriaticum]